jgi:hypothetical protein
MSSVLEEPKTVKACDQHLTLLCSERALARENDADTRVEWLTEEIDRTLGRRSELTHLAALAAAGTQC